MAKRVEFFPDKVRILVAAVLIGSVFGLPCQSQGCGFGRWRCWQDCCTMVTCPPASCRRTPAPPSAARPVPSAPTVAKRFDPQRHRVTESDEPGTEEELRGQIARLPANERVLAAANVDNFAGTDRKAAKTSIASTPIETFSTIGELLDSLPSDQFMRSYNPPITEDADSDRVQEEKRNVSVTAFLYATKKEADNDYHMILGAGGGARYMTAEISGLPARNPARAKLKIPRTAFQDYFSESPIGSNYRKFDPPIAVRVAGSLFFDMDHVAGVVGPNPYKPHTSWEIHPVTEIELAP